MALAQTEHGWFYYFAPDVIGKTIASGLFWDMHFRPYIDQLKDGDVFVDVGSNIGFFSIYCGKKGCEVYSFECSKQVFDLLERNVELNNLQDKVKVFNFPLYDSEIKMQLNPEWSMVDYEQSENSGGMSLVPGDDGFCISKTLDSFNLTKVNLIKVDTQGADLRVLVGARKTIQRCRPIVLFEIEPIPARLHGDDYNKYM
jgi:FkbM family methyltransferase